MDKAEAREVSGNGYSNTLAAEARPSSYWIDACEDVSYDDRFVGGEAAANLGSVNNGRVDLPSPTVIHRNCDDALENLHLVDRSVVVNSNGKRTPACSNGFKHDEINETKRPRESYDAEQKHDRKSGGRDSKKERRIWERAPGRKRQRGWDDTEMDGQIRDQQRRRERYTNGSWKERDNREARGFWERDKDTNELVFRVGSWESCRNRNEKVSTQKSNKSNGSSEEREPEEPKEKPPEEQARQYQLDVLEQAKKRNTIAFLETGAGKTLIAVLLMRSISNDLEKQNKKMLAVFLVPKVPLVYQQSEVIRERTGFQVGHYCGEMGQDFWDARRWQREFESKQVFLMQQLLLFSLCIIY